MPGPGRPVGHIPANKGKIGVRQEPRTAIRILREFFAIMDADNRSAEEIASRAGMHKVTMSYWRHGQRTPSLLAFEACCQEMGFRLVLEPIIEPGTQPVKESSNAAHARLTGL